MLKGPVALPGLFVRFIGVAETLGAIGLILPWLLRIRPVLTPLAAGGLVIIMIGATVITLIGGGGVMSLIPALVGILAAFIAHGRGRAVSYRAAKKELPRPDPSATKSEASSAVINKNNFEY